MTDGTERVDALARALHETDGTQHYIVHDVTNDGDEFELIACNGVPHDDDARTVLAALTGLGWSVERVALREALERLTRRHTDRVDKTERVTHGPAWVHVAGDPSCFICAALGGPDATD